MADETTPVDNTDPTAGADTPAPDTTASESPAPDAAPVDNAPPETPAPADDVATTETPEVETPAPDATGGYFNDEFEAARTIYDQRYEDLTPEQQADVRSRIRGLSR